MFSKVLHATTLTQRVDRVELVDGAARQRIESKEVLLVGIFALSVFTLLLLRLPYRAPLTNLLLSTLALGSLYLYLRLRLSIRLPVPLILCLVVSLLLDMIGNRFGLFSRRVGFIPYDIITHFAASGLSFIPVMWLMMELMRRFSFRLPLGFVAFFSATTAFSLAAYYEITELIDERLLGGQRLWTPRDSVQDLAADLVGIVIASVCYGLSVRKRWHLG
jgi:uncharacterized membrane protein YjdF